jgi:hypothetical protein
VDNLHASKGPRALWLHAKQRPKIVCGTLAFSFQKAPANGLKKLFARHLLETLWQCPSNTAELAASSLPNLTAKSSFMALFNYPSPASARLLIFKKLTSGMFTIEQGAILQARTKNFDQHSALAAWHRSVVRSP